VTEWHSTYDAAKSRLQIVHYHQLLLMQFMKWLLNLTNTS